MLVIPTFRGSHRLISSRMLTPSQWGRAQPSRTATGLGACIALAIAAGYLIHHVGPLDEHDALTLAAALVVALVAGGAMAAVAPGGRLPPIVVARPGSECVRPAERRDIGFTAALHSEALAHGFFVQLGGRFMRSYHRTFLESPHAVFFVATVRGVPVGFLAGLVRPGAHARWALRHRGVGLALGGVVSLSLRPATAVRFLRTRTSRYIRGWRRNRAATGDHSAPEAETAVLSHVAVVPGARGSGAGRRLVDAFVDHSRQRGAIGATLVTLESEEGAGRFYKALGWVQGPQRKTPDGLSMVEWSLDFRSGDTPA